MKRFISATIVPLLLFVVIFNASCAFSAPPQSVVECLGTIAVKVVTSVITDDPLPIASLLQVVPDCINATFAVLPQSTSSNTPSSSNPSSPEATIGNSSIEGVSTGSVNSNTVSNCGNLQQSLEVSISVPFQMVVGPSGSQNTFNTQPNGSSDNDIVAQQLFQQYGNLISSKTTPGPGQYIPFNVPAHTQVILTMPIQISYKEGGAEVIHTNGSTTNIPWLFTDGYHQTGPITYTYSSC